MFIIESIVLGLLVALNPCQLAINVSALTYLNNTSGSSSDLLRRGWLYTAGRTLSYSLSGIALTALVRFGLDIKGIQMFLGKAEGFLPYLFILIGLFLLYRVFHAHSHHGTECHNCGATIRRGSPYGPVVLGLMLAFAFCPESAILFFGMLIPLGVSHAFGWTAPVVFALSAGIPVAIMAYAMSKAREKAVRLSRTFTHFQQWMNALFGVAFIVAAIVLIVL